VRRSGSAGLLPPVRLPCGFHDVSIGIRALDTDIVRLVPLLDDADAVRGETVSECQNCVSTWETDSEVEECRQPDRLVGWPESEGEALAL
jgi:hypothetical protein